ncbi:hypothetical protein AGMMS50239_20800 [Bacteroidia bacterium]|nr:hypothetical protein AGMMS50239_20800 [Bacteroidia bacterium]
MHIKVYIDPRSTINYSSFYIQGLYDYLGKNHVHFSSKYFDDLKEIDMLMAFVIIENDKKKKYIIDYRDQDNLIDSAYQWTDIYAKINVNTTTHTLDTQKKLITIPPGFGIKIWNPLLLFFHLFVNFCKAKIFRNSNISNIHLRPKLWIRNYLSMLKRQKITDYAVECVNENSQYGFFVSTFWGKDENAMTTNAYRYQYMLSCIQHEGIDFHGGFVINKKNIIPQNIPQQFLFDKFFPNTIYQKNIKKSIFVFNTPAVHNCHGWKIAEFLAMGKAIISTPLSNEIPVSLEHDKDIYFVKDEKEIGQAVDILSKDKALRCKLEKNAKMYFNNHALPVKVIERILITT